MSDTTVKVEHVRRIEVGKDGRTRLVTRHADGTFKDTVSLDRFGTFKVKRTYSYR